MRRRSIQDNPRQRAGKREFKNIREGGEDCVGHGKLQKPHHIVDLTRTTKNFARHMHSIGAGGHRSFREHCADE